MTARMLAVGQANRHGVVLHDRASRSSAIVTAAGEIRARMPERRERRWDSPAAVALRWAGGPVQMLPAARAVDMQTAAGWSP